MSVLESISEGLQGFTQGAQQGLDIYQQVQTIKDQGDARRRRAMVEQKIGELVQSGAFDPKKGSIAPALEQGAQIMLEAGDYEGFGKWYEQGQGIRKLDSDRHMKAAFGAVPTSPQTAVQYMNKAAEAAGLPATYKWEALPTGGFRFSSGEGSQDYADINAAKMGVMDTLERIALDPGKYIETKSEQARALAQARQAQAKADESAYLTPLKGASEIARAGNFRAGAASAIATAGAANELAETRRQERQPNLDKTAAEIANLQERTKWEGKTKPPAPPEPGEYINRMIAEQPVQGLEGQITSPTQADVGSLSMALQNAIPGLDYNNAEMIAVQLASLPPEALKMITVTEGSPTIDMGNGNMLPNTPGLRDALAKIRGYAIPVE